MTAFVTVSLVVLAVVGFYAFVRVAQLRRRVRELEDELLRALADADPRRPG